MRSENTSKQNGDHCHAALQEPRDRAFSAPTVIARSAPEQHPATCAAGCAIVIEIERIDPFAIQDAWRESGKEEIDKVHGVFEHSTRSGSTLTSTFSSYSSVGY